MEAAVISIEGPDVAEFKPDRVVHRWLLEGVRACHVCGAVYVCVCVSVVSVFCFKGSDCVVTGIPLMKGLNMESSSFYVIMSIISTFRRGL